MSATTAPAAKPKSGGIVPRTSGLPVPALPKGPAPLDAAALRAAAERAYLGDPVDYVSPVPRWLSILRVACVVAVTAWAAVSASMVLSIQSTTRTIGRDAAPSVVAAERVRTLLADANGNFANVLLTKDPEDGSFMSAFRQDVRDAETALADAARNVTYGPEETGPIVTLMRAVPEYADRVGQARAAAASADGRAASIADARAADAVMHFTILPAAAALERVNHEHLSETYEAHRGHVHMLMFASVALGLAALGAIGFLGLFLARRTRRLIDPFVAAAFAVVVAATGGTGISAIRAESNLRTAKADAFDSISALSTAQAYANDANAAESFWLLNHGDTAAQAGYAEAFRARAARLSTLPPKAMVESAAARRPFKGLLGDEIGNITFEGEREAAVAAVAAWARYVETDARIRALESEGRTAEAVAMCVGTNEGQSNWAFDRFDKALGRVVEINRAAFEEAIGAAESNAGPHLLWILAGSWLLGCAGAWVAAARRLRAYEF